ncbi:MAG: type I DNA topoisomerase [Chlamydiae bacterium]|nr:type I DNA topoisomerase [Chlamydiota bacterium]MBI3265696.1 type I DNA topoisomerase [Chlamydiota bacterium]
MATRKKTTKAAKAEGALVIVESPAKAKTINKILGPHYHVTASMGHVRDLPSSDFGVDVEHGFTPKYRVLPTRKKMITELKKTAGGCEEIFLAPDPDREGEAIAWHLAEIFREGKETKDKKILRVTFNEITKGAVQEAFKHPRQIDMSRVDSQQARRILDRMVGYKISPLLWRKVGKGLSAGRVQSVAVRLICEREEEIRKFIPKEFWSIEALLGKKNEDTSFEARLDRIQGEKMDVSNAETAQKIAADLESLKETFMVANVESKDKTQKPYPPFITSQLQQAAANTLRFPVYKTMKVAQELYEGIELGEEGSVGLITYMRTDSYRVSQEAVTEATKYVQNRFGNEYLPDTPHVYKAKKGAQEAHEAIRPSSLKKEPDQIKAYLSEDQYKLYRLIWKRFLQSQMSLAQLKVHSADIAVGLEASHLKEWEKAKYLFRASGQEVLFPGYLVLEEPVVKDEEDEKDNEDSEKEVRLPHLEVGEKLNLQKLTPAQHFTKPPPRYNEASLVKALEEREIGRPSTYAPIIQTIVKRAYVEKDRSKLIPTELGFTVTKILVEHFPKIMDVEFTAKMEADLDEIEEGKEDWKHLLAEFYGPFMETVDLASKNMKSVKQPPVPTSEVCEKCGSMMVIRTGRFGKFLACSGFPKCRNVKSIDTGIACPKEGCTGKIVQRRSKRGRSFYGCTRYPECDFTAADLKAFQPSVPGESPSPSSDAQGEKEDSSDEGASYD